MATSAGGFLAFRPPILTARRPAPGLWRLCLDHPHSPGGQEFGSVTSYGTRPTFDGFDTRIETHILDFQRRHLRPGNRGRTGGLYPAGAALYLGRDADRGDPRRHRTVRASRNQLANREGDPQYESNLKGRGLHGLGGHLLCAGQCRDLDRDLQDGLQGPVGRLLAICHCHGVFSAVHLAARTGQHEDQTSGAACGAHPACRFWGCRLLPKPSPAAWRPGM